MDDPPRQQRWSFATKASLAVALVGAVLAVLIVFGIFWTIRHLGGL